MMRFVQVPVPESMKGDLSAQEELAADIARTARAYCQAHGIKVARRIGISGAYNQTVNINYTSNAVRDAIILVVSKSSYQLSYRVS